MAKPVVPSIPGIGAIADPATRLAIQAIADGWQLRNGQSGSGDEKFLTKADLEKYMFDPVNGAFKRAFSASGSGSGKDGGSNGSNGNDGKSIIDTIVDLTSMLMKTYLWRYLNEGINTLVKPQWIFSVLDNLWLEMGINTTLIKHEESQRVDGDTAVIQKVDIYAAKTDSAIGVFAEALGITVSGATVNVTRLSGLGGAVKGLEGRTSISEAAIQTEQQVRVTSDTAIAKTVTDNYAATNGRIAQVQTIAEAASTNTTANANLINTVQARLNSIGSGGGVDPNSPIVSLEQRMQAMIGADNTMLGSYTLKIDTSANGKRYVSGFGISTEFINGNYQSQFLVNANYFAIGDPTNPGVSNMFPFIVDATAGKVYIKTAMINVAEIDIANVRGTLTAKRILGDINTLVGVNVSLGVPIGTGETLVWTGGVPANAENGHKIFAMLNVQGNIPGGANGLFGRVVIYNAAGTQLASSNGITYTNESGGVSLSCGIDFNMYSSASVSVYISTWAKTGTATYIGGLIGGLR